MNENIDEFSGVCASSAVHCPRCIKMYLKLNFNCECWGVASNNRYLVVYIIQVFIMYKLQDCNKIELSVIWYGT